MKTLIVFFSALLLGLAGGAVFTLRSADHEVAEVVTEMQQPHESSARLETLRSIRAIELIQSGESSNAIQLLSEPIASYYYFQAKLAHNDQRIQETLALIEQFARTNRLIADAITNQMQGKF